MLRFEVSEDGQQALPAVDLSDDAIVIGSSPGARIRLPAQVANAENVVIRGGQWRALAAAVVDGVPRKANETGPVGEGVTLAFGSYRVRVAPAPAGAQPTPPQRTESLARELVRGLLGDGAAPTFEVVRGPVIGAKRMLPPPESTLVIGRGDEAHWVIVDEDLSRAHAEVRRGWDGVTIRDLGSKNGTRVAGRAATTALVLDDGDTIELGKLVLRFRDPAQRHLRGVSPAPVPPAPATVAPESARPWRLGMVAICIVALGLLAWVLVS